MDVESRLERALERDSQMVRPDVPGALVDVRRRAQRRTATRRASVAAAVVGVALVAGVLAKMSASGSEDRPSPVTPPR